MTTLDLHPWNFMPTEILEHIFSFLPVRERHNVSHVCELWATAVSSSTVWSFTEVHCNSEETGEKDGGTSSSLLEKIQPYTGHIQYLKIVLDILLELNRRLACSILFVMVQETHRLQGLEILCSGKKPFFYSGQDLLHSLRWLFQSTDETTMQDVNFPHIPFALDSGLISLLGRSSPNLRTLLIRNFMPGLPMLKTEVVVEVLMACPKLSTLGISYFTLSRRVFQELLKPNREPLKYLELFYDGKENDISEDCWTSAIVRHPGFCVGLEFAVTVRVQKINQVLKPYLPISQLSFNSFTHMANQVMLVANLYARTLKRLFLNSPPSIELNLALIQLAKACLHLEEIHCFCMVGQEVVEAFRCHCPHLRRYTLSPALFFTDNPPTVFL